METAKFSSKKLRVAGISLLAAFFIVGIKLLATLLSGSVGVLSELFHSSTDLIATVATILSIRYSTRPPDKEHHYGHEKIESFSALFQVFILVIMCAWLIYESVNRIFHPVQVHIDVLTFSVIIICIAVDYSRSRALMKVAKETHSQALEADALHFSSDILSSIVVLIGMVFTYFNIFPLADPLSAIVVSFIIIMTTLGLSKKAIDSLLDRVPKGIQEDISLRVSAINGIEGIKSLRIRGSGSKTFIDMIILIGRTKLFSESHGIMDTVEKTIKDIVPEADIVIHSEPVESDSETINDKIKMAVTEEGYKCHDIFSHRINNEIFTELHVEIENTNDLVKAHSNVNYLESKIKEKIPVITNVKIHLDEPSEILYDTLDVTEQSKELIRILKNILDAESKITSYRDIRVIKTGGNVRVSLNCAFGTDYSFEEVHETVTILESRIYITLKELFPNMANIIIHAEPS
ncbi:MAG: cation diffusion facilitator family transporter [Ignavibacteriae bacterium]|nr:cation diffusion facilitator family transporter [Ignavibacteriota bacterium]